MKTNKSNNRTVSFGYGLVFLLSLPYLVGSLGFLFSERNFVFSTRSFPTLLPVLSYYLYTRFVVKRYYAKKTKNIITSLEKKVIVIDEMLSYQVDKSDFIIGKNGVCEYYFIIYNKKNNKYIRISSVDRKPSYHDTFIPNWKGNRITIFVNPNDWNDSKKGIKPVKGKQKSYLASPPPDFVANKNTLRVFKFNMGNYNLDDSYEYSINENIIRKENIFIIFLWTTPFLILCGYAMYYIMSYLGY